MMERFLDLALRYVLMPFICLLMVAMMIVLGAIAYSAYTNRGAGERLMQQCMADGNPEYVCVSMLRSRGGYKVP